MKLLSMRYLTNDTCKRYCDLPELSAKSFDSELSLGFAEVIGNMLLKPIEKWLQKRE